MIGAVCAWGRFAKRAHGPGEWRDVVGTGGLGCAVGMARVVGIRGRRCGGVRLGGEGASRNVAVGFYGVVRWIPHSFASGSDSHHHLPARSSSPGLIARVHGAHPMLG